MAISSEIDGKIDFLLHGTFASEADFSLLSILAL